VAFFVSSTSRLRIREETTLIWRRLVLALLAAGCATAAAAQSSAYLDVYKDASAGPLTSEDLAKLQACKDSFEAKRPGPPEGSPPSLEFIQAEVTALNQCAEDSRLQGVHVDAAPSPIAPIIRLLH
jgi:hypothetical protein